MEGEDEEVFAFPSLQKIPGLIRFLRGSFLYLLISHLFGDAHREDAVGDLT
jgi:hypothetical protein